MSPSEAPESPWPPVSTMSETPRSPDTRPINCGIEMASRKKITAKIAVKTGPIPKISPPFVPVVIVRPDARK